MLLWGGVGFGGAAAVAAPGSGAGTGSGGGDEAWLQRLSIDAEHSLRLLRAIAVHAVDPLPSVPLTTAELRSDRLARWRKPAVAAAASSAGTTTPSHGVPEAGESGEEVYEPEAEQNEEGSDDSGGGDLDALEQMLSLSPEQAAAVAAQRAGAVRTYGALTARTPGLAVLRVETRAGRCKAAVADLLLGTQSSLQIPGRASPSGAHAAAAAASAALSAARVFGVKGAGAASPGRGGGEGLADRGVPANEGSVIDIDVPQRELQAAADASVHIERAARVLLGLLPTVGRV
jgi:hypothetical protein